MHKRWPGSVGGVGSNLTTNEIIKLKFPNQPLTLTAIGRYSSIGRLNLLPIISGTSNSVLFVWPADIPMEIKK